jgi:hypothetical protein
MFSLTITPRPGRWVSRYHSEEEEFFAEELGCLVELERRRESFRPPHPTPAD